MWGFYALFGSIIVVVVVIFLGCFYERNGRPLSIQKVYKEEEFFFLWHKEYFGSSFYVVLPRESLKRGNPELLLIRGVHSYDSLEEGDIVHAKNDAFVRVSNVNVDEDQESPT